MKQKDIGPYYQQLIDKHTLSLQTLTKKRFWLSVFRFAAFALFAWALTSWIVSGSTWLFTLPSFILFLVAVTIDKKLGEKLDLVKEFISINKTELQLFNNDLNGIDDGSEFLDPSHAYCDDLNIFGRGSLFQHINRTTTRDGKEKLADMLKHFSTNANHIKKLQLAIQELRDQNKWRQTFRASGNLIKEGSITKEEVVSWFKNNPHQLNSPLFKGIIYFLPVINIAMIMLFLFGMLNSTLGFSMVLVLLIIYGAYTKTINWYSQSLSSFSSSIKKYDTLINILKESSFTADIPKELKAILSQDNGNAYQEIRTALKLLNRLESRNNIIVAILFNGIYLRDLHTIRAIDQWQKRNIEQFPHWFDAIAEFDALNSLAGFAFNHPEFCLPELSDKTLLKAKNLGHPLIDPQECVTNDIAYEAYSFFYVVTGANMAGKSTFLRTVTVNLIMASCGLPVFATTFIYTPVRIFTSIGTFDDLIEHTSYFKAELLRLKKLSDEASKGEPLFIVLDEILKGTNSEDKRKGSIGVLKKLIKQPVYGLVATHDLDLGRLQDEVPNSFKNICFEISFEQDQMLFDYKLRNGLTQNMNASYLLKTMDLI